MKSRWLSFILVIMFSLTLFGCKSKNLNEKYNTSKSNEISQELGTVEKEIDTEKTNSTTDVDNSQNIKNPDQSVSSDSVDGKFYIGGGETSNNPIVKPTQIDPKKGDVKISTELKSFGTIIKSTQVDPKKGDANMSTKLKSFALDFDGDNVDEKIELYTSAERNDIGDMIWDDGQTWLLVIQDGNEYYPLFEEYVQLGEVYFNVWYNNENTPEINIIVSAGAGFNIMKSTYDKEQKGYKKEKIYEAEAINLMFSSIPNY